MVALPRRLWALAIALFLVVVVELTEAFLPTDPCATCHGSHYPIASPHIMGSHDHNTNHNLNAHSFESFEDLDHARKRFEALFVASENDARKNAKSLMSSSSRRRRLLEMELLQSLQDSDDAVEELVTLWMTERGPEQAQLLQDMQDYCSDGLVDEEALLRQLQYEQGDDDDDDDWLEVSFRLAMLLYYKGQSIESKSLCWHVLRHKPWHFEAAHLALLLAFREGRQDDVWRWAREQLPPLNPQKGNARRHRWVERAVLRARESLERAELELLHAQQQESLRIVAPPPRTSSPQQQQQQQQQQAIAEENTFC